MVDQIFYSFRDSWGILGIYLMLLGEFTLQSTPVFCFPVLYYHILLMQPNLLSPLPPFHSISPSPPHLHRFSRHTPVAAASMSHPSASFSMGSVLTLPRRPSPSNLTTRTRLIACLSKLEVTSEGKGRRNHNNPCLWKGFSCIVKLCWG